MLTKLIKHDFKNIGKLLLPLNVLVLLMTLVGIILNASGVFELENSWGLLAFLVSTYSIGIVVIMVISFFYPIIHYYRNLFSKQGYLTFTLPVCSWKILASKTIVGWVWYLVNMAVTIFSVWAIAGFPRVSSSVVDYWNRIFLAEIGMSFNMFFIWMIFTLVIGLLNTLLMAYFCISVGQLYAKHKIIASVVVYVGLYTVIQILIIAIMVPFLLSDVTQEMVVNLTIYGTTIFTTIFSVLYYLVSGMIMKKKVNLD
jgi:hypothetical protein